MLSKPYWNNQSEKINRGINYSGEDPLDHIQLIDPKDEKVLRNQTRYTPDLKKPKSRIETPTSIGFNLRSKN